VTFASGWQVVGEWAKRAHPIGLEPVPLPDAPRTEDALIPTALAIAGAVAYVKGMRICYAEQLEQGPVRNQRAAFETGQAINCVLVKLNRCGINSVGRDSVLT
jgi:hypothetical protein